MQTGYILRKNYNNRKPLASPRCLSLDIREAYTSPRALLRVADTFKSWLPFSSFPTTPHLHTGQGPLSSLLLSLQQP